MINGGKYSQVVSANNGKLYLVPYNANKVMSIDVRHNQWTTIGDDFGNDCSKWMCGALCTTNGKLFCGPYNSNNILIVDTNTDTTEIVLLPTEVQGGTSKYHTCVLDKESVYFFPFYAPKMIQINVYTHEISILHTVNCGKYWKSAIRASNGLLYGISYKNDVIQFNPHNHTFQRTKLCTKHLYRGGQYTNLVECTTDSGSYLYALPCNGPKVIQINKQTLVSKSVGDNLGNGMWKYKSAVRGQYDNCVYGIPSNAPQVVRFDPSNDTFRMIGEEYKGGRK